MFYSTDKQSSSTNLFFANISFTNKYPIPPNRAKKTKPISISDFLGEAGFNGTVAGLITV